MKNKSVFSQSVFIVAEAGVNHNGRLDLAKHLVAAAKEAGADAVKFQTWKTEEVIVKGAKTAAYQESNTGETDQFDMVKKLELSYGDFTELKAYADSLGIIFFSTPDEEESLNFLADKLNVPFIKIGSGEITNPLYLKKIAAKGKPTILSTGMGNMAEVKEAVKAIEAVKPNPDLVILHCTSNYPCPLDEVNLGVLKTYQETFLDYVIGYSDHTMGILVPQLAVASGAKIIEKHFTLDNKMEGPDHIASLNPQDFKEMVLAIRLVEKIMGDSEKNITESEKKIKPVVQKTIVAKSDLAAGTIITESDIMEKRTSETGLLANQYQQALGKKLKIGLKKDSAIKAENVE